LTIFVSVNTVSLLDPVHSLPVDRLCLKAQVLKVSLISQSWIFIHQLLKGTNEDLFKTIGILCVMDRIWELPVSAKI